MKLIITINTENDAFEPDPGREAARILRGAAQRLEEGFLQAGESFGLRDLNGNKVGLVRAAD